MFLLPRSARLRGAAGRGPGPLRHSWLVASSHAWAGRRARRAVLPDLRHTGIGMPIRTPGPGWLSRSRQRPYVRVRAVYVEDVWDWEGHAWRCANV
jgi:hypothetical protein